MADIGIVMLDNRIPRPPGDVGNAASFPFPVAMAVSTGADTRQVVENHAAGLLPAITATAKELADGGVSAVTTCCGFLAVFQQELADSLEVPVATSSLLQVPLVLRTLRQDQVVCVLTANAATLTDAHLRAVGVGADLRPRVHLAGLERTEHLYPVLTGEIENLDVARAEGEVVAAARAAIAQRPEIGAFVFECTNLPPYAAAVRADTGRPVWDALSLIGWLHAGTVQPC
ncbi:aspartate/glutamate racemase family protein [Nonomuraea sp. H19]|uniref:aspartate/glutamate racemase family protein n=1 Tax=Nonomuraea sp. H19 TaxID=3452206 RepID=UPI003F8C448B